MRNSLVIAKREFAASFKTPMAYILMGSFLFLSGFFFFGSLQWFNSLLQQAALYKQKSPTLNANVITPYLHSIEIILVFLMPALTMRALTEEKRSGTYEFLLTSPLKASEIVFGKFLGLSAVVLVMLVLSSAFPLALSLVSQLELAPVFSGILGMFLFGLSFLAVGVLVSAFFESQTVAAVVGVVVMLVLYIISIPAAKFSGSVQQVLLYLSPPAHTDQFYRGVIGSSDIFYFVSLTLLALLAAVRVVENSRWR